MQVFDFEQRGWFLTKRKTYRKSDKLRRAGTIFSIRTQALICLKICTSPGGGMVDAADLKSVDRKVVRVQVPPRALL
jgi:hypothetical protein